GYTSMKPLLCLMGVLSAGLFLSAGAATPESAPAPAHIVVTVPTDARVTFDGYRTRKTGVQRTFVTPPLPAGQRFAYEVRAEVTRGGQVVGRTVQAIVRAGQTTRVDLAQLGSAPDKPRNAPRTTWPLTFRGDGGLVTIFTPQVEK